MGITYSQGDYVIYNPIYYTKCESCNYIIDRYDWKWKAKCTVCKWREYNEKMRLNSRTIRFGF